MKRIAKALATAAMVSMPFWYGVMSDGTRFSNINFGQSNQCINNAFGFNALLQNADGRHVTWVACENSSDGSAVLATNPQGPEFVASPNIAVPAH